MKLKKIFKTASDVVFYLFLVLLLFVFVSNVKAKKEGSQPSIFGYGFYSVLTGSMEPTIHTGSLIITKQTKPEDIKVNDIITFKSKNTNNLTTHRVIEIKNDDSIKFITQGDANNTKDPAPIDSSLFVGKVVFFIPFLGSIALFIKSNLLVIFLVLILFLTISKYIKKIWRNKNE